jgi:hypothetical protein
MSSPPEEPDRWKAASRIGSFSIPPRPSAPLLGALLITVLSVGMNLTKVDGSLQPVVIGLVVVASTFIDRLKAAPS